MINSSDRRMRLSFTFLLLLTVAALYLSFLVARPFLGAIVTASLLALSIYPLFTLLLRYVRNRGVAALLATLTVLLVLLLPATFVVNTLASETKDLYGWLNQQSSAGVGWEELLARLTKPPLTWIERETGISSEQLRSAALDRLRDASSSLLNWAKSVAVDITGTIVNTLIMLFTLFYFLRDGASMLLRAGSILPLERRRYDQLLETISDSMRANFYAVIVVSLAQSVLGALGYWIAGLPSVMLWAVMTALFSILPAVGAAAVWGVGVIYLAITGHLGSALFLLVYGTAVVSVADNVIRPLVLSGRVKLNALLVFFSLLGGVQAFGIIGLFVGPIIVSIAIALLTILTEERARWEHTSDEGSTI